MRFVLAFRGLIDTLVCRARRPVDRMLSGSYGELVTPYRDSGRIAHGHLGETELALGFIRSGQMESTLPPRVHGVTLGRSGRSRDLEGPRSRRNNSTP